MMEMLMIGGGILVLIVVLVCIYRMTLPKPKDTTDLATQTSLQQTFASIEPLVANKTNTVEIVSILQKALPGWTVKKLPVKSGVSPETHFKSNTVIVFTNAAGKTDPDSQIWIGTNGQMCSNC